jgi:acyl-ACP thioesterase
MDAWMEKQRKWAMLEDNHIAWRVYEWDLGPQRLIELDRNADNV